MKTKTTQELNLEVEKQMITLHGKKYKFKLYPEQRSEISNIGYGYRTVEYSKGTFDINVDGTMSDKMIEMIKIKRDKKLQELGI